MKKPVILLLLINFSVHLFSQKQITVSDVSQSMSKGDNPAFKTEIPQAAIKDVERDWKKYLNTKGKGKQSETNGEIMMKGMEDKEISTQPFNIYSTVVSTDAGVSLTVWFTYNDSIFFSRASDKNESAAGKRLVRDFASAEYFLAVRNELKREKDKLEKQKDDLEKQIRLQEKSEMRIADNKRAITRAQEDLTTNAIDQKEISADISRQEAENAKARSANADAYKEADKALKSMEDDKRKLQGKADELHKKTDEWNKEITGEERDITTSKQAQQQLNTDIEKQKTLIKSIQVELKAIK